MSVETSEQDSLSIVDQDRQMLNLLTTRDNTELFNQAVASADNDQLMELTAVYFLRPHYVGGAPMTPARMSEKEPLHARIMSADPSTIADTDEKRVLEEMQQLLSAPQPDQDEREDPSWPKSVDQKILALMLVPNLIRKYPPQVGRKMFNEAEGELSQPSSCQHPATQATYAEIVRATIDRSAAEPQGTAEDGSQLPPDDKEVFERLKLATNAYSGVSSSLARSGSAEQSPAYQQELEVLRNELAQARSTILTKDFGLKGGQLRAANLLMASNEVNHKLIDDPENFHKIMGALSNPEVQELITNDFVPIDLDGEHVIRKAIEREGDATAYLKDIRRVMRDPEFAATKALSDAFRSVVFDAETSPFQQYCKIKEAFADPVVVNLRDKLKTPNSESSPVWDQLADLLMRDSHNGLVSRSINAVASTPRLKRLIDEPSTALPRFIDAISHQPYLPELVTKAGSGIIADNYAQASKLVDPVQIDHYLNRVRELCDNVHAAICNRDTRDLYANFVEGREDASAKDQARAARLFSALSLVGSDEISEVKSLDELELTVINGFLSELIGERDILTAEESTRLVERFDGITPLLTYAQQHLDKEAYRAAIAELTVSVADGSYETWRRGDGSEESMRELVVAGYLPEAITSEQYKEWVTDRSDSSREELVSSAKDTAKAIREAVELASLDMSMLTPGYQLKIEEIPDIIAERNGLGRLLGVLNKTAKAGEQPLLPDELEAMTADLQGATELGEVSKFMDLLRDGTLPKDTRQFIETKREQLEQTRLLIRLANVSAAEVAQGALLKDPTSNDSRKVQQKLFDVLDDLRTNLPAEMQFIPTSALELLNDHTKETRHIEELTVEDTIDPKVTLEIGETPQQSCQHYATGGFNRGLIGYFGPEVKIQIVRNSKGGIIARSITRLMQDEEGKPVIYTEPVYSAVAGMQVTQMLSNHIRAKAKAMGVEVRGSLGEGRLKPKTKLIVRELERPAGYSDGGGGIITTGPLIIYSTN